MRHFTCSGIILRKQNSGENDYFLTIFSPELGRIQALSRGSRKITSHKSGHLDILNFCNFQFYQNGDRLLLTECRVENAYQNLKSDLKKSLFAFSALEIILKSLQEDQENQQLFSYLQHYLEQLSSNSQAALLLEEFKIKTLKNAGTWPEVSLCHFCRQKWNNQQSIFIDNLGQLTCSNCRPRNPNLLQSIPFSVIKLANFMAQSGNHSLNIKTSDEEIFNLQKLTGIMLQIYLQQELKTTRILHSGNL